MVIAGMCCWCWCCCVWCLLAGSMVRWLVWSLGDTHTYTNRSHLLTLLVLLLWSPVGRAVPPANGACVGCGAPSSQPDPPAALPDHGMAFSPIKPDLTVCRAAAIGCPGRISQHGYVDGGAGATLQ